MSVQRVAIIGLGYVGLPLVGAALRAGHTVIGYDTEPRIVQSLSLGKSHVDDITDEQVSEWLTSGFRPTQDEADLRGIDSFVICVPTPLDRAGDPDLGAVRAATRMIARNLDRRLQPLVVLESTTYPGTTEEVIRPLLEQEGRIAGRDFALAFSPERIDPGNSRFSLENTPKIVGGLTPACTTRATEFYESLVREVVVVKGLKEAEMTKLLENTYRHVNIALVNELAKLSHLMDIDIWEVIRAASTKPFGFQAFYPGPGVGGHCIPIDPNYLSHRVRAELGQSFRFVDLAQEINASMPLYVVQRVQEILNDEGIALRGARILVLGVTYKRNVGDTRESPAIPAIEEFLRRGADLQFHDPHVEELVIDDQILGCTKEYVDAISTSECVVILQDHNEYLINSSALLGGRRVLDTRGTGLWVHRSVDSSVRWVDL